MPHIIMSTHLQDRHITHDFDRQPYKEFFRSIALGEELTSQVLLKTPDPFFMTLPRRGGVLDIFESPEFVWNVKESVKRIIEDLEPGIHEFIPINLQTRMSETHWGQYFILNPGQAVDAVVIDETDFLEGRGRTAFEISSVLSPFGQTTLDAKLVDGLHLWRGGRAQYGVSADPFWDYLFCSNELAAHINRSKLKGWCFQECKVTAR